MVAKFKGNLFWTFGDTACPRSARQDNCDGTGMHTVGAVSCIPGEEEGEVERKTSCRASDPPNLTYFTENASIALTQALSGGGVWPSPKPMAPFAPLGENTWVAALSVIHRGTPHEALYANYVKNPGDGNGPITVQGMARWNESSSKFDQVSIWPLNSTISLNGAHTVEKISPKDQLTLGGYILYSNGVRVPATEEALSQYSAFERVPPAAPAPQGVSASKGPGDSPARPASQYDQLGANVNWNAWTGRYITVGVTSAGAPGDVFVAFSNELNGPWRNGTSVASHQNSNSSCYNPLHLTHFDLEGGRIIHIACTFTAMWSSGPNAPNVWTTCLVGLAGGKGCAPVVPRYEYNNIVYRVDLAQLTAPGPMWPGGTPRRPFI